MTPTNPRIGIIGTGYVGLVTGTCFADLGFDVTCLDVVEEKVDKINKAIPPIFENGLNELLDQVVNEKKLLRATLNREEVILNSDIIFICLPTPSSEDGSIDLRFIDQETKEIGKLIGRTDDYKVIVVKSTVIPGTTSGIVKENLEAMSGKTASKDFGLAMNPEFLMEGLAISNFSNPDRVVIGTIDDKSFDYVNVLYQSFNCPILKTPTSEAEMIKYASNSFLSMKISFINEIANICEPLGLDVGDVAKGMGLDDRIGPRFLRAGVGFGGSCFPKDVRALYALSKEIGRESNLLKATLTTNENQPLRSIQLLESMTEIKGKTVALLGLAFKPDTDDMREAPSILISKKLIEKGAIVKAYDPIAKESAKRAIPNITHCDDIRTVLQDAHAVILVTEWSEFRDLSVEDFKVMKTKYIVDGRRVLNWENLVENGYNVKVLGQSKP